MRQAALEMAMAPNPARRMDREAFFARLEAGPEAARNLAGVARRVIEAVGERHANPDVAVILGSGLGGFERRVEHAVVVPYEDVGLPAPSVAGHAGDLVVGTLHGRAVAVLAGRAHYYEGHDLETAVLAVRVMAAMGVRFLLLSNAAGGIRPAFRAGDLMLLTDHVNMMGANPLRGPNLDLLGPRFPDMTAAYDPDLRERFLSAARWLEIDLHQGVYLAVSGPTYETPAEIRAFATLGADAVGMSTVPEVIAAQHAGLRVAAVSCITNMAAGLSGGLLSHDEVKAVGAAAGARLSDLVAQVIADLPGPTEDDT